MEQQPQPEKKLKGFIYKIINDDTDAIYIGSTIYNINRRFSGHKYRHKKGLQNTSSYQILCGVNPRIELIEEFTYKHLSELRRREGKLQQQTANCINKNIAGRINTDSYKCNACNKVIKRSDNIPRHKRSSKHLISEYIRNFHNQ
jgi:hypothetical protein